MIAHKRPAILRAKSSPKYPKFSCNVYYLAAFLALCLTILNPNTASAQGYSMGGMGGNGMGMGGTGYGAGMSGSGMNSGNNNSGGGYYGTAQANIDRSIFSGNHEILRNDIDYQDYLLQKRNAFAQQIQQNDLADDKLRSYAEKRLKTLGTKKTALSTAEQAESHDLMDWLKKDAEQRANNLAWLKRQDSEIAMVEQDQDVAFKNQRNSLHNMFEDTINVESQYKWNQQMQLAQLHQQQQINGVIYGSHQPFANQGAGGYGDYGGGYGGYGRRWGY